MVCIDSIMEDSRYALFVEPGAYIQKGTKNPERPQKIIFQEPYESVPAYHMDSGFQKSKTECNCEKKDRMSKPQSSPFNIQSLAPILGALAGGTGSKGLGGIGELISSFGGGGGIKNLISTIMSNPEMLTSVMKLFTKNKTENIKQKSEIKKSDLEIKNYTRVQ